MLVLLVKYVKTNLIGKQVDVIAKSAALSLVQPTISPGAGEWVYAIQESLSTSRACRSFFQATSTPEACSRLSFDSSKIRETSNGIFPEAEAYDYYDYQKKATYVALSALRAPAIG